MWIKVRIGKRDRLNGMRMILLIVVVLLTTPCALPQQSAAPQLSPSEELKAATAPLKAVRSQSDDLTQADLFAFGVGVSRAEHACLQLEPSLEELTKQPNELLALTRLCAFGHQYDLARQVAMHYLALPAPPERENAMLLLAQAFLGLRNPVVAAGQIFSLEKDYPYDPKIQAEADQVILAGTLLSDESNSSVLGICGDELKNTLPLLENGKGLSGKHANTGSSELFVDAVRCVDIARDLHEGSAQTTLTRLQHIVLLPEWQRTAELATMQSALARTEMIGKPTPVQTIHGKLVRAMGPPRPYTVTLAHGTSLLVPFTLWSSGTLPVLRDFHATAPHQAIYLLTSWTANTGAADEESKEILASLRSTAQSLPAHTSILVVADTVLQQFHADTFPAAIVVRNGAVQANLPLVGDAAKRMTVLALGPIAPRTDSQHHPHT